MNSLTFMYIIQVYYNLHRTENAVHRTKSPIQGHTKEINGILLNCILTFLYSPKYHEITYLIQLDRSILIMKNSMNSVQGHTKDFACIVDYGWKSLEVSQTTGRVGSFSKLVDERCQVQFPVALVVQSFPRFSQNFE